MQQLHDQALTEPEIPVYICTMPTSLGVLLGMHQEGIRMVSVGSGVQHPEPNPDAPLFEQYQAGSAAYWIATYCQRKLDAPKVSSTD